MKKVALLFLVLVLMASLFAFPASAKGENAKGAVKVDIVELLGIDPGPPRQPILGEVVGSLMLNTTASGKLIVNVNMDATPDLENYDVIVRVWYQPPAGPGSNDIVAVFADVLNTNAEGQGNALVMVDIDPPESNEIIWAAASIREGPTDPPTPSPYIMRPPPVEVPLK